MTNGTLHVVDPDRWQRDLAQLQIGDGEVVTIVVMAAADAKRYYQLKWYWGYLVKQAAEVHRVSPAGDGRDLPHRVLAAGGADDLHDDL